MELKNLNAKQVQLLNTMWSIDEPQDLERWQRTLSREDYRTTVSLQQLLIAEYFDAEDDCELAALYLDDLRQRSK